MSNPLIWLAVAVIVELIWEAGAGAVGCGREIVQWAMWVLRRFA
ncbi:MAG: hypothetical protein ACWGPR_10825 [Candidatus Deferrimicrobiaceae bacterium]